jgi:hypothetical protein
MEEQSSCRDFRSFDLDSLWSPSTAIHDHVDLKTRMLRSYAYLVWRKRGLGPDMLTMPGAAGAVTLSLIENISRLVGTDGAFPLTNDCRYQPAERGCVMSVLVSNPSKAPAAVTADEMQPHRPLWPVFVIAFGMFATLLWIGTLLWLLWRML